MKFPIFGHDTPNERARLAAVRETNKLREYWQGLRHLGQLPRRVDIHPLNLCDLLPKLFLIEQIGHGLGQFRVAGSDLSQLLGMDLRGMPISQLISAADRAAFADALHLVFNGPAILDIDLEATTGFGQAPLEAKLLILPLAPDSDGTVTALGALCPLGQIGRSPRRFLMTGRSITPLPRLHHEGPANSATKAGSPSLPQAATIAGKRPRPDWLRVVK